MPTLHSRACGPLPCRRFRGATTASYGCTQGLSSPTSQECKHLHQPATTPSRTTTLLLVEGHLPWPKSAHLSLWHAATLLREHRGDGHVAALLLTGLDGCEALLSFTSSDSAWRGIIQPNRGWTNEEWEAARERLERRGWTNADGLTGEGMKRREEIERRTDILALPPLHYLGTDGTEELYDLLVPLARTVITRGGIPMPNPVGVPQP